MSKKKAWRDASIPCKDKDLKARNKKVLYPKGQVPESDYSKELESFHKRRKRVFTEMNPIESRLDIPGRIIHLVKSFDKYVPHWASLLLLRDIELSINVIVSIVLRLHVIFRLCTIEPDPKVLVFLCPPERA